MRVLFVRNLFPTTGSPASGIFVTRQIDSLTDQGLETRNFYLENRTSFADLVKSIFRLRREIKEWRPDLVHAQYGSVTSLVSIVATRKPVVISFCGSDLYGAPDVNRFRSKASVLFSHVSSLFSDAVICKSEDLKNRLRFAKNRARVIPNGVDIALFRPIDKVLARSSLEWNNDDRVILFSTSSNSTIKGFDLAQQACAIAGRCIRNLRMEVIENVPAEKMPLLLNASDCLLVTSKYEGSPNIVKEALACNLPIVSVQVGDVRERLGDVFPSQVVARDPDKIAEALVDVLKENRRSNGREKITEISLDKTALKLMDVYRSVFNSRSR